MHRTSETYNEEATFPHRGQFIGRLTRIKNELRFHAVEIHKWFKMSKDVLFHAMEIHSLVKGSKGLPFHSQNKKQTTTNTIFY